MATIADMITSRLRQIDAAHEAELVVRRAAGGRVGDPFPESNMRAAIRERMLWDAIEADQVSVWAFGAQHRLRDVTDSMSRVRAEMRVERHNNGSTPALRRLAQLERTLGNLIAVAASRQSDLEAALTRPNLTRP